jgi:hypothetical protein
MEKAISDLVKEWFEGEQGQSFNCLPLCPRIIGNLRQAH